MAPKGTCTARRRFSVSTRVSIAFVALAFAACTFFAEGVEGAFSFGRRLTIDASQVSGSGGSLSNFPVVVNLTDNDLRTTGNGGKITNANGYDIIFRAYDSATCGGPASCTLDHEIESYDGVTGTFVAWVRIPELSQDDDTALEMHYSDPSIVTSQENVAGVWNLNYKGVWHLKEDPADAAPQFLDSTSNPNDGTASSLLTANQVPGQIDGSLSFDDSNERHVNVPHDASLGLALNVTVSTWIRSTDLLADGDTGVVVSKWGGGGNSNYWLGKLNASDFAFFVDASQSVTMPFGPINDGVWHHVVGVADVPNNLLRIYVDGIQQNSGFYTGAAETGTFPLHIGKSSDIITEQEWNGGIDEVRLSEVARSPDWLLTSFKNQSSVFPFYRPTVNYRSIGTNGGILANSGTASMTTGSATVSFTAALPAPGTVGAVGLGDELVLGTETFHILSRDTDTQVTVDHAAAANHTAVAFTITRAYGGPTAIQDWETGRQGDLLAANRREVGVAYKDGTFSENVTFGGSTTDASRFMWLTVAEGQRHDGTAAIVGTDHVVLDPTIAGHGFQVVDDYTRVGWFEVTGWTGSGNEGVRIQANDTFFNHMIVHDALDTEADGFFFNDGGDWTATIRNTIVYNVGRSGIYLANDTLSLRNMVLNVESVTVYNCGSTSLLPEESGGINVCERNEVGSISTLNAINVISVDNADLDVDGDGDFNIVTNAECGGPPSWGISDFNLSSDTSAPGASSLKGPGTYPAVNQFADITPGAEDLHLKAGADAIDQGTDLSGSFCCDIDFGLRPAGAAWDIGADEFGATTAVEMASFAASGYDREVLLEWETASELDNLGFQLYRSSSEEGSYERITATVIPGLGSSPVGAKYAYRDAGLTNGVTYYYKLEDIETTGKTELHGPVSATPAADGSSGGEEPDDSSSDSGSSASSSGEDGEISWITYGDPSASSLRVVKRDRGGVVLELETAGFYAAPQEDGTVRLEIPGFETLTEVNAPGIPVKRAWVEALAGRKVKLVSVRARDVVVFTSLRPADAETPEIEATRDGTVRLRQGYGGQVRAARRRSRRSVTRRARAAFQGGGLYPSEAARVVSVGFQGDVKKALVEIAPLRWDASRGQLLLARRLVVRLSFRGREPTEQTTDGVRGRRYRRRRSHERHGVVARLATTERGLHAVRYEEVLRARRGFRASAVRLSRQGETVAFHLEPSARRFKPGSTLYFMSEGASANPYGSEEVYELEVGHSGEAGESMPEISAAPSGEPTRFYWHRAEWEENRYYQAALLEAPDLWLWDLLFAPVVKSYPFEVSALALSAPSEVSKLSVWLQGVSNFRANPDHHVRVYVNGSLVEELSWDGKQAKHLQVELAPGLLREGDNLLELENVGDTEAWGCPGEC